jgi:hypothetical protein
MDGCTYIHTHTYIHTIFEQTDIITRDSLNEVLGGVLCVCVCVCVYVYMQISTRAR